MPRIKPAELSSRQREIIRAVAARAWAESGGDADKAIERLSWRLPQSFGTLSVAAALRVGGEMIAEMQRAVKLKAKAGA